MQLKSIKREAVKAALSPFLTWPNRMDPVPGFSIILGTPWALRDLLEVNLQFVARTDVTELDQFIIVFDRVHQRDSESFIARISSKFPQLQLKFLFHPIVAGSIVQRVNQSKFFASTNWVTGLGCCRTKYAILHDFDLYPLVSEFFVAIVEAMKNRNLRFCAPEYTYFDGLTEVDKILGTWELGIDVEWLRGSYQPIDTFHKFAKVQKRVVDLDAYSWIQSRTAERGLTLTVGRGSYAHVTNLCSTYLRFMNGQRITAAWRLHSLLYLESLASEDHPLSAVIHQMRTAKSSVLQVGNQSVDFRATHVTCANVLEGELKQMEEAIFGSVRPQVREFVEAFQAFLEKFGDVSPLNETRSNEPALWRLEVRIDHAYERDS